MSLMMCEGKCVGRDEISTVPTPEGVKSWKPVQHMDVIVTVVPAAGDPQDAEVLCRHRVRADARLRLCDASWASVKPIAADTNRNAAVSGSEYAVGETVKFPISSFHRWRLSAPWR